MRKEQQTKMKAAKHYLSEHRKVATAVIIGLLLLGITARFSLVWRGYNFDFESWLIIGDIVKNGQNVYAETWRYPYGPVWATMLGGLRHLSFMFEQPDLAFRYLIIAVLTVADIGIWALLKKYFGYIVAFAFFLCPASIIITGFHNQIDAMAVLFALTGTAIYGKQTRKITRRNVIGLLMIGVSLATKHLFFMFPLWLAIRQKGWKQKITIVVIPVLFFLLSFAPFWGGAAENITNNVFLYKSFNNAPFWYMLVPRFLQNILSPAILFIGALLVFGFTTRKRPIIETTLVYTLVLVVFSSAIANQYLITVLPAIIVFYNHIFGVYIAYSTLLLAISPVGLHSAKLAQKLPSFIVDPINKGHLRSYDWVIVILALGLFWNLFANKLKRRAGHIVKWINQEFKFQLRSLK